MFKHTNYDDTKKLLFIHNPKAGGTSIRAALGMHKSKTTHLMPSDWVPVEIWNNATILLCVRHPVSRFISAYDYHVRGPYKGGFLKVFADLKNLSPEDYLECIKSRPKMLPIQTNYLHHAKSSKTPDIISRLEDQNIAYQLEKFNIVGIKIERKNVSPVKKKIILSDTLQEEVQEYYKQDFLKFGYSEV